MYQKETARPEPKQAERQKESSSKQRQVWRIEMPKCVETEQSIQYTFNDAFTIGAKCVTHRRDVLPGRLCCLDAAILSDIPRGAFVLFKRRNPVRHPGGMSLRRAYR